MKAYEDEAAIRNELEDHLAGRFRVPEVIADAADRAALMGDRLRNLSFETMSVREKRWFAQHADQLAYILQRMGGERLRDTRAAQICREALARSKGFFTPEGHA